MLKLIKFLYAYLFKIPPGDYCYKYKNGKRITCPYWDIDESKPYQYNGYCHYLKKGDWEIEEEQELKNLKTGEIEKGKDVPFPTSLLWDQVKECGIKDE